MKKEYQSVSVQCLNGDIAIGKPKSDVDSTALNNQRLPGQSFKR
jgi:hypothetical protein